MRAPIILATLLLQFASLSSNDPVADPRHFHYERTLVAPAGSSGQTCAILDSSVFAHAATESLNDLRLYAGPAEIPFNFSVSGTQSAEDDPATLRNLGVSHNDIVFDIVTPQRPYSAVILNLAARDFLANATVSGSDGHGGPSTALGTFAVFDLSSQHLSRSTTLPLQESTFPELHVSLHITPAPGSLPRELGPSIVRGVMVPPSREAQTLYTAVASTSVITRRGRETLARIHVPAHVPVERVSFTIDPAFSKNFFRDVAITASPDNTRDASSVETLTGNISHVKLPADPGLRQPAIDNLQRTVEAALGANLRSGATVQIAIDNGDDPPLPIASVQLEMRQRKICFDALPNTSAYTLMYGDPALRAPIYDYARLFVPIIKPASATLASEQFNPAFTARRDDRPYTERHPELLWIALLAVVSVLASVALRRARMAPRQMQ